MYESTSGQGGKANQYILSVPLLPSKHGQKPVESPLNSSEDYRRKHCYFTLATQLLANTSAKKYTSPINNAGVGAMDHVV